MESFILLAGLVLFSSTVTYDLHAKNVEIAKMQNQNKVVQMEPGFFNQDIKK